MKAFILITLIFIINGCKIQSLINQSIQYKFDYDIEKLDKSIDLMIALNKNEYWDYRINDYINTKETSLLRDISKFDTVYSNNYLKDSSKYFIKYRPHGQRVHKVYFISIKYNDFLQFYYSFETYKDGNYGEACLININAIAIDSVRVDSLTKLDWTSDYNNTISKNALLTFQNKLIDGLNKGNK